VTVAGPELHHHLKKLSEIFTSVKHRPKNMFDRDHGSKVRDMFDRKKWNDGRFKFFSHRTDSSGESQRESYTPPPQRLGKKASSRSSPSREDVYDSGFYSS
jgi:hypothetical protein